MTATVTNLIQIHDSVALIQDLQVVEFMTELPILLRRGQVGTVVEAYENGAAFEVEFSRSDGQPYALISVAAEQLMPLYYEAIYSS